MGVFFKVSQSSKLSSVVVAVLSLLLFSQEVVPPFIGHEFLDGAMGEDGSAVLGGADRPNKMAQKHDQKGKSHVFFVLFLTSVPRSKPRRFQNPWILVISRNEFNDVFDDFIHGSRGCSTEPNFCPGSDDWLLPVHLVPAIYWLRLEDVTKLDGSIWEALEPLEIPFKVEWLLTAEFKRSLAKEQPQQEWNLPLKGRFPHQPRKRDHMPSRSSIGAWCIHL